ncbi:heparin lyase I family protein [Chitinophaga oryzae]|uniref:Heparin lyase I family protein n=1 Tax=Chitinophaga oryzae TaxID=2725414 RepID=A0AAE6ZI18_9BACT|nr:heparin lyase I family protein [Chitinophaga oryzae]QJB32169.1 heparin lyase I family protein [Chitinophaga oryzae]QJB38645.1 heparin lyase I family protein [Chitinophaga oryzae]
MKRSPVFFQCIAFLAMVSVIPLTSCQKEQQSIETVPATNSSPKPEALATGDTLLNVSYESGTLNSGIAGLGTTAASAPDAAYMITPGSTGNYGIAHKVTLDDTAYSSAGQPRSESDALNITSARYQPGDARRYEFSVLLKDWTTWTSPMPADAEILFQAKPTSSGPSFFIAAKRNAIVFRHGASAQDNLVADYTGYINQWIDFRVDVLWSNSGTGTYSVYTRLPGGSYTLKAQYSNESTYNSTSAYGYIKWGLYRADQSTANGSVATRIAYHDNIRIIAL